MGTMMAFADDRIFVLVSVLVLVACTCYEYRRRSSVRDRRSLEPEFNEKLENQNQSLGHTISKPEPVTKYHELYHQLQNLESHPEILSPARDQLIHRFNESLSLALQSPQKGILRLETYNAESLRSFVTHEHDTVMNDWSSYLEKGKSKLFNSLPEARKWLSQRAPSKLVDGAWLSHIHKLTTPFALRAVTKDTWQILSEELGDGDINKNHVYVYQKLLNDIGCRLPDPSSRAFLDPKHIEAMDDPQTWKSAVGQLLISLFPNEFLPEILGFNMHYELISLEAMMAARELKMLRVDPSYFLLHVCIDNADTGHTAMALLNVMRYMDMIDKDGVESLEQIWKRVQAGYTLSQTLAVSCEEPERLDFAQPTVSADPLTLRVIEILKSKTSVSQKYHCHSKARIGNRTLAGWLDPQLWDHIDQQKHLELLDDLAKSQRWVTPGNGRESKLVQELCWGGRMFGAFTSEEVDALVAWIDGLGSQKTSGVYYAFTDREPVSSKEVVSRLQDPAVHHPVLSQNPATPALTTALHTTDLPNIDILLNTQQALNTPSQTHLPDLIPLWFAHIALLENTINVPARTATPLYSNTLLALRAQAGFALETDIPAGMNEMARESRGLVEMGLEMVERAKWSETQPSCLKNILDSARDQGQSQENEKLVHDMLHWANAPDEKLGVLLGLALAFLGLKQAVAVSSVLLSRDSRVTLGLIIERERNALTNCATEIQGMGGRNYSDLQRGYCIGRGTLEKTIGVIPLDLSK